MRPQLIQSPRDEPTLITIGEKSELLVIRPEHQTLELTGALKSKVTAFHVFQADGAGKVRLMIGTKNASTPALYTTDYLEPEIDQWKEKLAHGELWRPLTLHESEGNNSSIDCLVDDGNEAVIATSSPGSDAAYFRALIPSDNQPNWERYSLPENSSVIQDIQIGAIQGKRGVFLLYSTGQSQTLAFQSFFNSEYRRSTKYRFSLGEIVVNDIFLGNAPGNNNILFAASNSCIVLFESPDAPPTILHRPQERYRLVDSRNVEVSEGRAIFSIQQKSGDFSANDQSRAALLYSDTVLPEFNFYFSLP